MNRGARVGRVDVLDRVVHNQASSQNLVDRTMAYFLDSSGFYTVTCYYTGFTIVTATVLLHYCCTIYYPLLFYYKSFFCPSFEIISAYVYSHSLAP
jgi:hypothetical protein